MNAVNDPLAWVSLAEEDYALSKSARRHRPPLAHGACFHAQQCAEKYLKALLVTAGHAFPKVHDLAALDALCTDAGIITGLNPDSLDLLTSYAVRARYPGEALTAEDAQSAVKMANDIRRFCRKYLGLT